MDRVTGERYSYEGEGVLGDYGAMLTEDESESADWSGSYTCKSSGVSVTLSQTDPETFSYAFSDGVSGAATAAKDSACLFIWFFIVLLLGKNRYSAACSANTVRGKAGRKRKAILRFPDNKKASHTCVS